MPRIGTEARGSVQSHFWCGEQSGPGNTSHLLHISSLTRRRWEPALGTAGSGHTGDRIGQRWASPVAAGPRTHFQICFILSRLETVFISNLPTPHFASQGLRASQGIWGPLRCGTAAAVWAGSGQQLQPLRAQLGLDGPDWGPASGEQEVLVSKALDGGVRGVVLGAGH